MADPVLAGEFPQLTREDWLARAAAVLKDRGAAEGLATRTPDGFIIEALHGQTAGVRAARPQHGPWTVCQRADHPDPGKANAQALDDLANGAGGLVLVMRDSATARGFGLDSNELGRILQGVHLHAVTLRIEGPGSLALADLIARQPIDPERMRVAFNVSTGAEAAELARRGHVGPYAQADGRRWHERGATDAEELGATLAAAVALMRAFDTLNDVYLVRAVAVTLAAHQEMFATLAKFRAMRLLWQRVIDAAGLPEAPLQLHGETSFRMLATSDPHTNMLRATAAVFGAGLGGADSITVLPFSLAQGPPNALARRMARNVQILLLEESNLWRVSDPASGAGYMEAYTSALCRAAWTVFQRCEAGIWPAPDPDAPWALPVIGTSAYRLAAEYPAEVEAPA